eukprot:g13563.t1 g13563   contig82:15103-18358(+)
MFEKTLNDLVTGIRTHRRDTALYISQNISEIKQELKSPDFYTKSNALQKLTFLQMMGYTMSWAAFASVEVMSSPRFALKRVGYLAACQGLDQPEKSPVVLLTTNLLKKELRGATVGGSGENMYHAGLAINCLSNIATEDLGRELLPDLLHLLNHPSPYVRKKALLCLYKVFLKYPQGLRLSFDKIKQCLEDPHPSVVSCAVNVITELSDKNPKNYLPLAPAFFKLLTSSANNWMLIKVVKLLGSLVPEEPRLARKLLDPLCNIVKSTHAKSLLYEAVFATTLCLQYVKKADGSQPSNIPGVVDLCVETLRGFVRETDQNLKYLGLVGFGSLLQSQPKVLHSQSECKGLILQCLSDEDVTIRTRALGLLKFMTTKRNLVELITQLLSHVEAASGEYRCDLVDEIVRMCSSNKYELLMDFAWYVDVLVILAGVRGIESQGEIIAKQWMDVAWRVLPVRSYSVRRSLEMLVCRGPGVVGETGQEGKESERHFLPEVLPAAAWIVGEYSHLIPEALESNSGNDDFDSRYDDFTKGPYHALVQSMTAPTDAAGINPLPCTTQAVFVQNAMKVFAAACQRNMQTHGNHGISLDGAECSEEELHACVGTLLKNLDVYAESPDVEVKERSFTAHHAKAQRRKLAEGPPSPVSVEEWEAGVNWDAFQFTEEETPLFARDGSARGSVEGICFTKQQTTAAAPRTFDDGRGLGGQGLLGLDHIGSSSAQEGTENTAFGSGSVGGQFSDSAMGSTHSSNQLKRRVDDPFYLNSSPPPGGLLDTTAFSASPEKKSTSKDAKDAAEAAASRFGSIKLDSGGESDEDESERRSKKKSKRKKKASSKSQTLSVIGPSYKNEFVDSDDEVDHDVFQPKRGSVTKSGRGNEFATLAMVDLTTPLGEDDVMPRNEHYVVPERPRVQQFEHPAKHKKPKKDKKKKSSRRKDKPTETTTGDLLGFDFGAGSPSVEAQGIPSDIGAMTMRTTTAVAPAINPINSAFDDLLGLEMPLSTEAPSTVISSNATVTERTTNDVGDKERKVAKKVAKKAPKKKKSKSKD